MATKKKTDTEAEVQQNTEDTERTESVKPEGISFEEAQAAIMKMLAEAKAEAEAIVANAEARVKSYIKEDDDAEKKRAKAKAKEENLAWGEELVRIKLFKDAKNYKDPKFVSCNGETILIQRGVYVDVKRKFVEILDNSEIQDCQTNEMIARLDGHSEKLADL